MIGRPPLILDGGWATELQARGLALGEPSDAWNLSHAADVLAVARSYVEAGARAILTNTFQANPISLARTGREGDSRRINLEGARISREASGRGLVFGSIGPAGWVAGPVVSRTADAYALQADALAEGGVDALVLETFGDLADARSAARAALATGLPLVASFYFDTAGDGPRTFDGSTPEEVARAMEAEGVDGVGANCGAGIDEFPAIARRLASACNLPVWIKPNAGLPTIEDVKAIYATSAADFAAFLPKLVQAGADCIGGCCGTTPEFIAALRRAADAMNR